MTMPNYVLLSIEDLERQLTQFQQYIDLRKRSEWLNAWRDIVKSDIPVAKAAYRDYLLLLHNYFREVKEND